MRNAISYQLQVKQLDYEYTQTNRQMPPPYNNLLGSLGIAPTRNCTYFLKIGFVVAGGAAGFIPINPTRVINQIKRKNVLCMQKDLIHFLKDGCNSTSTYLLIQRHHAIGTNFNFYTRVVNPKSNNPRNFGLIFSH